MIVLLLFLFVTFVMTSSLNSSTCKIPKLIAFDLDGTIWSPDMYQLWGGGAPFSVEGDGTKRLKDKSGSTVRLLGVAGRVLQELKTDQKWKDTKVAWVSCTDEPEWAAECLQKFKVEDGRSLNQLVDSVQIYKANKQRHFENLKKQYPHIDYTEMIFFDNEGGNIRDVSKLKVHCVFCPDGVTQNAWESGLKMFERDQ